MRIRMQIETPTQLDANQELAINSLASRGFGQEESPAMLQDTREHLANANFIQQAYDEDKMVGFAMYRRVLWR